MREGAKFITSPRVNKVNLNYIVKRLERCATLYDDCWDCPDLEVCRQAYDRRCLFKEPKKRE